MLINNLLKNSNKSVKIIVYGKNCNDEKIYVKYNQLNSLGFYNVYIYTGGLFEWLLLQDIYGATEFPTTKKELEKAADLIVKICGNTSILINQIVPSNFVEYWNILKPLMKSQYQNDGPLANEKRNELFELVVTRDNVGEAMWYMYTGLLIASVVQLKITTRGCAVNPKQMAKNYQNYVAEQEKSEQQQQQATSTVYTITN
jgi:hypothetical protein